MNAPLPMAPTRPVLRYHGGKWRIAPWIINHFPPHKIYVEPFGGAASVLLQKKPAHTEIYNDLDESVVSLFRVMRHTLKAEELSLRLDLTPYSRADFEDWAYSPAKDDIDAAHKLVARSFMGMSSKGVWQKSGFDTRVNSDGFVSRLNAFRFVPKAILDACIRLRMVVIEREDALDLIARHDRLDTLFYCDPPYVQSTRNTKIYRHDMTDTDHEALAERLHSISGMCIVSGYASPLYAGLYEAAGWRRVDHLTLTDKATRRVESLWISPRADVALRGRLI